MRRYNDRFNGRDVAASVKVSANNLRVYVAGTSWGGSAAKNDYLTIAYTRGGYRLWTRRFNGRGSGSDQVVALARSPDGSRIFVTGQSCTGAATGMDYATIAYSSNGTPLWIRRYDGPAHGEDGASAIAVSPDGERVYVTGTSAGATSDYATMAYNAATGETIWTSRYDSGLSDAAVGLAVSAGGTRAYVTGTGAYTFNTVAYDTVAGTQLWAEQFDSAGDMGTHASAIAVS